MSLPLLFAIAGLLAGQTPPPAQPAAPVQTVQRPAPPPPYNEAADARAAIAKAIEGAATDEIRVLINWGANDNDGTPKFQQVMRSPDVTKGHFTSDEYRVVNVNVGHLDRNLDVAKAYGMTLAADALPAFTILDDKGRVLARASARDLALSDDPAAFDPAKVAAFLTKYQAPPPPDAQTPLQAALKQAKKDGKFVFVWFSAPW